MLKVSVAIIMKDEERCIEKCIQSVYDKAFEIIVVDTGSTDKSKEIVLSKFPKAKLYTKKWNGDFSSMRNFAISKAKGKWLFQLDADETFEGEFPEELPEAIYNFKIRNLTDSGSYVESFCARLVPNIKGMMYTGKIHEIFSSTKKQLPITQFKNGHIVHDGYITSVRKDKDKNVRNIEMLKEEHIKSPTAQTCFYLGQEHFIQGDKEKSLELAKLGLSKVNKENGLDLTFLPILYHLKLSNLVELNLTEEIEEYINTEYELSNNPECCVLLANYYATQDIEDKMLKYATDAMSWNNAPNLPVKYSEQNIFSYPYILLGDWYNKKGNKIKALFWYELAHGNGLDDEKVLGIIYQLLPKIERLLHKWEYYGNKLYQKTKNIIFLKELINCFMISNDPNKNKQAIDLGMKILNPLELIGFKEKLTQNGKLELARLIDIKIDEVPYNTKCSGDISVVIPTMLKAPKEYMEYNLTELEKNGNVKEILIVDNSCGEGEFDFSKYSKVKVLVQKENVGVNPAWNIALKEAKCEYLLLLNDDCLVRQNVLDSCIKITSTDKKVGLIACTTTKQTVDDYSKIIPSKSDVKYIDYDFRQFRNSHGWFIFMKTSDYKEIPNEMKIFYGDDFIHLNVLKSGQKVVKLLSEYISHDVSLTVNSLNIYNSNMLIDEGNFYKEYLNGLGDKPMVQYMEEFINIIKQQKGLK